MIDKSVIQPWLDLSEEKRSQTTFGELKFGKKDWYKDYNQLMGVTQFAYSRQRVMKHVVKRLMNHWEIQVQAVKGCSLEDTPIVSYKNVPFINLQAALSNHPGAVDRAIHALTADLQFDAVVAVGSRGYLMAGTFLRQGIPVVMCDKDGKIPGDTIMSLSYDTEYSTNNVNVVQKGTLKAGMRVVVVDDVAASGGTFQSVKDLVALKNATLVAIVSLFAVESKDGILWDVPHLIPKLRYLHALSGGKLNSTKPCLTTGTKSVYNEWMVVTPEMSHLKHNWDRKIQWGSFKHRGRGHLNLTFDPKAVTGHRVTLVAHTAHAEEFNAITDLAEILFRYQPKEVVLVLPFINEGTQDRVEADKDGMVPLALMDTLARRLRRFGNMRIVTFDLHNPAFQWQFENMVHLSFVSALYTKFKKMYPKAIPVFPDHGAAKRFGAQLGVTDEAVTFMKVRRGEERKVDTADEIKKGATYVLVDDMVRSGRTLFSVAQRLITEGAREVHAILGHAPLEPKSGHHLQVFTSVWTSDSCPHVPLSWVKVKTLEMFQ